MSAAERSDAAVEELLGAYALDACEPDEVEAIEAVFARRPDLAEEAARLALVAAWIGASHALRAPEHLRDTTLARARSRRPPRGSAVEVYLALAEDFGATVAVIPAAALDAVTANGLTARELIVHVAAQESLLAQLVGRPTLTSVDETDIHARTAAALAEFADQELADVVDAWRTAVQANTEWARSPDATFTEWRGLELSRHDALVVRAFETWVHADDLRRAAGFPERVPEARHLAAMADLAGRSLGLSLALAGRTRPGRTARLVLTGAGGGEWLVDMGGGTPGATPDVTVTTDAVSWCRLVADRIAPAELDVDVDGNGALAAELLASASVLATL